MKRRVLFLSIFLFTAVFITTMVSSNPKIMNFKDKDVKIHNTEFKGKKVNSCNYCHGLAEFEKKKQDLRLGQKNYKSLGKNKYCAGSGCH